MTPFAETEITRAIRQQALAIEIALLIRKANALLSLSGRRNAVQRAGFPAEFRVSLKHEERSSAIGPRVL